LQVSNTSLVPRGIKNVIELDKKNENQLWQGAIKTEINQLKDYLKFIKVDSKEDIPICYQKIPFQTVFNVKYGLRYKARLVAGNKEDIYPGVLGMDTVRIWFFLGECCACDIGIAFLYEKKRNSM
jgi:hypothetical protein